MDDVDTCCFPACNTGVVFKNTSVYCLEHSGTVQCVRCASNHTAGFGAYCNACELNTDYPIVCAHNDAGETCMIRVPVGSGGYCKRHTPFLVSCIKMALAKLRTRALVKEQRAFAFRRRVDENRLASKLAHEDAEIIARVQEARNQEYLVTLQWIEHEGQRHLKCEEMEKCTSTTRTVGTETDDDLRDNVFNSITPPAPQTRLVWGEGLSWCVSIRAPRDGYEDMPFRLDEQKRLQTALGDSRLRIIAIESKEEEITYTLENVSSRACEMLVSSEIKNLFSTLRTRALGWTMYYTTIPSDAIMCQSVAHEAKKQQILQPQQACHLPPIDSAIQPLNDSTKYFLELFTNPKEIKHGGVERVIHRMGKRFSLMCSVYDPLEIEFDVDFTREPLGIGKSGTVFAATRCSDSLPVAIKVIGMGGTAWSCHGPEPTNSRWKFIRERNTLIAMQAYRVGPRVYHTGIYPSVKSKISNDEYFQPLGVGVLVMDRCDEMLEVYMHRRIANGDSLAVISADVVPAIVALTTTMWEAGYVYRDLHSENIMFFKKDDLRTLQIVDFGRASARTEQDVEADCKLTVQDVTSQVIDFNE